MTDETTIWTKGDPTADLIHMLERAAEAGVRVTAPFWWEEATEVHSSIPKPAGGDYWIVGSRYVNTPNPHPALASVTSPLPPEPVRPDWLSEDAEDGDWVIYQSSSQVAQWLDGKLRYFDETEVSGPSHHIWHIWPVWAEVKAERERLTAEVERLSTVTDEMVAAAVACFAAHWARDAPNSMTAALIAALAKRDEGQS